MLTLKNAAKVLGVLAVIGVVVGVVVAVTISDGSGGVFPELPTGLTLSVVHLNDFHARFDETSTSSGACKDDDCIGGFARVFTAVLDLYERQTNSVFLNAGDNFQGTLYYNLFKWNITQFFLNLLPTDATTLGNHEFDDKIQGVVPFLQNLRSPVVVCNIDDSLEPDIQGLYNKSVVIQREGKKIGIVGVILSTTNEISSTEKLRFLDESESVNAEAKRLLEEEGVFTVIVLSHSGYDVDQEIARKAIKGVSLIVGAHSHTLLYTGNPPNGGAAGPYPTVIQHDDGRKVLVVQASAYTKYLGNIVIKYDPSGEPLEWEGNPVYLNGSIAKNEAMELLLEPYKETVEEEGSRALGETRVTLDQGSCRYSECNFGNLIADAMVASYVETAEPGTWTYSPIGIINTGGIRASIPIGGITYNDLVIAQPFENTFDVGELQGRYIKEFLEVSATPYYYNRAYADVNLLQLSGIRVVLDLSQPAGSRVVSLKVRCNACEVPRYEDVDLETYYRIATVSFLATGGDGYAVIANNLRNHRAGPVDLDVLMEYIRKQSPIIAGLDERIRIIGDVQTHNLG